MNGTYRKMLAGVGISVLTVAAMITVGTFAYRAGQRDDGAVRVVEQVVTNPDGATVIVPGGNWHGGWHWGGGPGFLILPLLIIGGVLLFRSGRGRFDRRRRDDIELRDWHRRVHTEDRPLAEAPAAAGPPLPSGPSDGAPTPTPPSPGPA